MTRPTRASGDPAVLSDDNEAITLSVYSSAQPQPLAVIELPPLLAVRLAGQMTEAAARHLSRADTAPCRPRGGDARAAERARRDKALRRLAAIIGADMPTGRLARTLAALLARYRPAATETAPDRVLMREIVASGLPVPGPDRLARILRAGNR